MSQRPTEPSVGTQGQSPVRVPDAPISEPSGAAIGWIAFAVYLIFAKDSPDQPPPKALPEYLSVLRERDAWWFMLFYGVTFGGCVGLSSSLTIYFNSEYGLTAVIAGFYNQTACANTRIVYVESDTDDDSIDKLVALGSKVVAAFTEVGRKNGLLEG